MVAVAPAHAHAAEEPHRRLVIGGDCTDCSFEDANLANAQFLGGDFSRSNFQNAELLGARLIDLTLGGADLHGASLVEARLANVGLDGADLRHVDLSRARLHQVRLTRAGLQNAVLNDAVFMLVDLAGANMGDVSAHQAVFRQTQFSRVDLRGGELVEAHFVGARLDGVDARRTQFINAIFENVDFTGADLRNAQFDGSRFLAVNLTGADFRGADGLTAASFAHSCGDQVRGLPDAIALSPCSQEVSTVQIASVEAAQAASLDRVLRQREVRRAQMEQARTAFEQALANIEVQVGGNDQVRLEALAAAREGWEAAAEALAEAELAGGPGEMSWAFEIRRAELGEPIRIILEQAAPGRIIVAPPPPPNPPAPKLPIREDEPARADHDANGEDEPAESEEG